MEEYQNFWKYYKMEWTRINERTNMHKALPFLLYHKIVFKILDSGPNSKRYLDKEIPDISNVSIEMDLSPSHSKSFIELCLFL